MGVEIIVGDALDELRKMPGDSVQCCVTSPPYWGLRDYGVAGQIGLEPTMSEYVARIVEVFTEVRRVLREDGTLWLNLGDSYTGPRGGAQGRTDQCADRNASTQRVRERGVDRVAEGLGKKNLCGIPWRVAFALQSDGWTLRSDIVWHKTNPMPESVTDRPTKAHEYVFLFSRSTEYFYDAEAIREPASANTHTKGSGEGRKNNPEGEGVKSNLSLHRATAAVLPYRNARSVWSISTQPFKGAHFATFPPALAERCILAGCPVGGTVIDPFGGAGTTGLVADRLGRAAVLIEINPAYAAMARERFYSDAPLLVARTAHARR